MHLPFAAQGSSKCNVKVRPARCMPARMLAGVCLPPGPNPIPYHLLGGS